MDGSKSKELRTKISCRWYGEYILDLVPVQLQLYPGAPSFDVQMTQSDTRIRVSEIKSLSDIELMLLHLHLQK